MDIWIFRSPTGLFALADDETGSALPSERGPWEQVKAAKLTGVDEDERIAEKLIRKHGSCCFDEQPEA